MKAHSAWRTKRITETERDLETRLKSLAAWQAKTDLLTGLPGVGRVTCVSLLTLAPERGRLNRRETAKRVGAPWANDSGRSRWVRTQVIKEVKAAVQRLRGE